MRSAEGARWAKWDLHIHTPLPLVQHYGGDTPEVWERFIALDGATIALDRYGASAPGGEVMRRLDFTAERVTAAALQQLGREADAVKEEGGTARTGRRRWRRRPGPGGALAVVVRVSPG